MTRLTNAIATGFAAVLAAPAAFADSGNGYEGYGFGGHMHDGAMHGYWMGPLMMAAFVIVAVVAVVLIIRWIGQDGPSSGGGSGGDSALDILRERYARGEIDDDEFAKRKATLSKHG